MEKELVNAFFNGLTGIVSKAQPQPVTNTGGGNPYHDESGRFAEGGSGQGTEKESDKIKKQMIEAQRKDPRSQESKDLQKAFEKQRSSEKADQEAQDRLAKQATKQDKYRKTFSDSMHRLAGEHAAKLAELKKDEGKVKPVEEKPKPIQPEVKKSWEEPDLESGLTRISVGGNQTSPQFRVGEVVPVRTGGSDLYPHEVIKTGVRYKNPAMDEEQHTHWAHVKKLDEERAKTYLAEWKQKSDNANIEKHNASERARAADDSRYVPKYI
jgi:hypothetical protein